jgi:predicted transport protein
MGEIKLFRVTGNSVTELAGTSVAVEKSLQTLIEGNLEAFLGVRFLASEYPTGKKHGGRIDTLGLDENGVPVIIEYKRAVNENVINQGLYYLDWLMDHRGEFELLVHKSLGAEIAGAIDWSTPRLVCIAGDYTKYDQHAVEQINRSIELLRYLRFGADLLLLELVNTTQAGDATDGDGKAIVYKTVSQYLDQASPSVRDLFENLKAFLLQLGDDVQLKPLKFYFAFKRIKNFACVEIRPQLALLLVYLKLDPDEVELEEGFSRDVRQIGHLGTGDLELTIRSSQDLQRAQPMLERSYENS